MTGQDELMNVKLDANELRLLCEAACKAPELTGKQAALLQEICHHMIWDDLYDRVTGIERHEAEQRQKRLAEFEEKKAAIEREYADLYVPYIDYDKWECVTSPLEFRPGAIIELRRRKKRVLDFKRLWFGI